jgi:lipopolysaccharide transport system ATP-binding protein
MSEIMIKAENLGKKYTIGHKTDAENYVALRDVLVRNARNLWVKTKDLARSKPVVSGDATEEFWALKDLNFEIRKGEALGIIGRNGAGKSTLLKVLSRITEPSAGRVTIKGRVASLLEVGTGFHPELTGRENVFLNGAILGMKRSEIKAKFDEIVAFAEVEKFLDTPVKRYSSGMYVRLAFAVAAHLEPEILVVDEVLAVGDAAFQKKCLGKMEKVSTAGRTVLFVSHNMNAIKELCARTILLDGGGIKFDGDASSGINNYLSTGTGLPDTNLETLPQKGPQNYVRLKRLVVMDGSYTPSNTFVMGEPIIAHIELECKQPLKQLEVGFKISSQTGIAIHYLTSTWEGLFVDITPGNFMFEMVLPEVMLFPGRYQIGLWASRSGEWSDHNVQEITFIEVLKGNITGYDTDVAKYANSGCEVYVPSQWKLLRSHSA